MLAWKKRKIYKDFVFKQWMGKIRHVIPWVKINLNNFKFYFNYKNLHLTINIELFQTVFIKFCRKSFSSIGELQVFAKCTYFRGRMQIFRYFQTSFTKI